MCFFFSSRRRHTRSCLVSWARRCVQETGINAEYMGNYISKSSNLDHPEQSQTQRKSAVMSTSSSIINIRPFTKPLLQINPTCRFRSIEDLEKSANDSTVIAYTVKKLIKQLHNTHTEPHKETDASSSSFRPLFLSRAQLSPILLFASNKYLFTLYTRALTGL
eukprot:TRINITY_DN808_c0_g5_i1.p1 TRINITY_DN808_c0_g5~~TRINITY_DN808_c0_g5_i1.p1  ORF type:complete len:163 (-),score=38.61 TRINITY_DN808_c0_g5_i1:114-602(-)